MGEWSNPGATKAAIERLREQTAHALAQAVRWRDPIDDQPPARRRVLIADDDGSVDIAQRMKDGRWVRRREGLFKKPRAWAHLPAPPEEVRDGE